MMFSVPNVQIRLVLALAFFLAAAAALIACVLTPPFYLEISMSSSRGGSTHLFYDTGAGINARDSAQLALHSAPRTVYRFPLSQGEYRALQFNPVDRDNCEIAIQNVRIVDLFGRSVKDFSPSDIVAGPGISHLEVAGGETQGNRRAGRKGTDLAPGSGNDSVAPRLAWRHLAIWSAAFPSLFSSIGFGGHGLAEICAATLAKDRTALVSNGRMVRTQSAPRHPHRLDYQRPGQLLSGGVFWPEFCFGQ